jgi:hypothetical protein
MSQNTHVDATIHEELNNPREFQFKNPSVSRPAPLFHYPRAPGPHAIAAKAAGPNKPGLVTRSASPRRYKITVKAAGSVLIGS